MKQKTALIAWGGWSGHTPQATGQLIKSILELKGFDVTLAFGTEVFADPNLNKFDLIIPLFTNVAIAKNELENLIATIAAGTGLAGCHSGMCNCFRDQPSYQYMTGGQWVSHPGNIINYKVNIIKSQDPIVTGIGDFDYYSEQYYMHVDPAIEILATAKFSGKYVAHIKDVVMPVVWKHKYVKARVFYCSLGHVVEEFKRPHLRKIIERGFLWAAR